MRTAAFLLAAFLPLGAQMATRAVPAAGPAPASSPAPKGAAAREGLNIPVSTLYPLERACDDKLRAIGEPNTVDMLGATRGIYLDGYGAVFTSEIGLASAPAIYPFHPTISEAEKKQVHDKMIERLPKLRATMREMVRAIAAGLPAIPDNQLIVVSVRLDYLKWEDTTGLPGIITVKADRKSALSGPVQAEEQ
jgi:hypothetical protein